MESPLVSILMTAYNREKYIAEAIESVLSSTLQDWELIIVDDGSMDQTVEIARTYEAKDRRIKVYINEKNLGDYPNRNRSASYATGKYIKYLDSDDIIYPCSLQIMVQSMEKFPAAGIGLSYNNYNNDCELPIELIEKETIETHFLKFGLLHIGPSGSIYNREYFSSLGGYGNFGVASDYEFNIRAACYKSCVLFQRDLVWWRVHTEQEFKIRDNEYLIQNHKIHMEIQNQKSFPLSDKIKKEILINYKKNLARKAILNFMKLRVGKAVYIIRNTDLNLQSFFFAFLPAKIRSLFV